VLVWLVCDYHIHIAKKVFQFSHLDLKTPTFWGGKWGQMGEKWGLLLWYTISLNAKRGQIELLFSCDGYGKGFVEGFDGIRP